MARDTIMQFLRVRPLGAGDAVRLYVGFAASLILKVTRLKYKLKECPNPGAFVPGRSEMMVRIGRVSAFIRPKSGDLVIIAGLHEPVTKSWFGATKGDLVFDVGAHVGLYTLEAAQRGARVIAVEPDKSNFELLKRNVSLNRFDSVLVYNLAVSNRSGFAILYPQTGNNSGTSTLELGWTLSARPGPDAVIVECKTLDELASALGVQSVDWLKLDVEGHEIQALMGAKSLLANTKNAIIEVCSENQKACLELLQNAGLKVKSIEPGPETSNWLCVRAQPKNSI